MDCGIIAVGLTKKNIAVERGLGALTFGIGATGLPTAVSICRSLYNFIIVNILRLLSVATVALLLALPVALQASAGTWTSQVTGGSIAYTSTEASSPVKDYAGNYLTVVYLENLGFEKTGGNSNADNVAWLLSKGYRVVELDYANSAKAVTPTINADIIAINDAIAAGSFCSYSNCSKYRSYVLFEGYRIMRDVPYFKDDPTVYNYPSQYTTGDTLHMDIVYPANPSASVPVVLSFAYCNSYATYDSNSGTITSANRDQRMNLGNTLAGFNDSFLEGAPANGIAWAIADHPKYCPWGNGKPANGTNDTYKSYENNPDAAQKVKSAVRTLRVLGEALGFSGKIGIFGFSRGSDAGSMAVGDRADSTFENAGFNIGTSDDVQAAALGSGVFDFTQIYNTTGDGDSNLETRCPWAWGALADNYALWQTKGSAYLAQTSATAPVLFFYNTDDSHYYQDQIAHFKAKLDSLGVPTSTLTDYGTGHAVPQTSAALDTVYTFFIKYLEPPVPAAKDSSKTSATNYKAALPNKLSLTLSPNPATSEVRINFTLAKAGKVQVSLSNLSGVVLYKTEKQYSQGAQSDTIGLNGLNLKQGTYNLKVAANGMQETQKLVKD